MFRMGTGWIDLRSSRKILAILSILVFVMVILDQARLFARWMSPLKESPSRDTDFLSLGREIQLEPLQVYQEPIERRNLFNVASDAQGMAIVKSSIQELVKDYRLKGIALFSTPEAILEDARTGSSVFVREDDKLGELKVKAIREESVILSHGEEEIELKIQGMSP